ncbi:MAG: SocA family protein [Bacilli bacterium]|nr:SocA family protein [Bacilli bacterium]
MNEDIIFDNEKFKATIHYIISKCGFKDNVGRTVLYKLLYFSDFDYYELYEESLTGERYIRKPKGPVPIHFNDAKNELINEGKIKETSEVVINYPRYKYSSIKPVNISIFSNEELEVIDDTINKISHMRSGQISDYSHRDLPWRVASPNEELDYEFVFYRSPEYSVREYDD